MGDGLTWMDPVQHASIFRSQKKLKCCDGKTASRSILVLSEENRGDRTNSPGNSGTGSRGPALKSRKRSATGKLVSVGAL